MTELSLKEKSQEVKSQHDLRYVFPPTRKRKSFASSVMDCCPFHNDNTPSLKITAGYFYCFGCGAQGDFFDFTKRTRNWNWVKTFDSHLELPVHPCTLEPYAAGEEKIEDLKVFPAGMALRPHFSCNQQVLDFYQEKGLTRPTILRFKLGFGAHPQADIRPEEASAAQKAFTIPLFDDGKLCGMKFRRNDCCPDCWCPQSKLSTVDLFGDDVTVATCRACGFEWTVFGPKYIGLHGQRRFLWGYDDIPDSYNDTVFIVEGEFDRMIMWQHGFHCVTATSGAASFNGTMANKLKRFRRVVALVDQDEAGQAGALLIKKKLPEVVIFPEWREGKDVSDVAKIVGNLTGWIKKQDRALG